MGPCGRASSTSPHLRQDAGASAWVDTEAVAVAHKVGMGEGLMVRCWEYTCIIFELEPNIQTRLVRGQQYTLSLAT
jgi:hypothetical protein